MYIISYSNDGIFARLNGIDLVYYLLELWLGLEEGRLGLLSNGHLLKVLVALFEECFVFLEIDLDLAFFFSNWLEDLYSSLA
jgi:hypothetical protein